MRRVVYAVLAAIVVAVGLPANAGPSYGEPTVQVWRLRRKGHGAQPIEVSYSVTRHTRRSAVMVVGAERLGSRWGTDTGFISLAEYPGGGLYPHAYGGDDVPASSPDCPAAALCSGDAEGSLGFVVGTPVRFDFFVVGVDAEIHDFTFKRGAWTAKLVPADPANGPYVRLYFNYDGPGMGAYANYSVERLKGVTAPGGRNASAVAGRLPCDDADGRGTMTGWGAAAILGGDPPPRGASRRLISRPYMNCADEPRGYDMASAATTWRLYGEAVGASVTAIRLAVFDFPKAA